MFLSRFLTLKQIVFALVIASMLISSLMAVGPEDGDGQNVSTTSVARQQVIEQPLGSQMNTVFVNMMDAEDFAAQIAIDFKEATEFGFACRACDIWQQLEFIKNQLRIQFVAYMNTQFIPGVGFDYHIPEFEDLEIMISDFDTHLRMWKQLYPEIGFADTEAFIIEMLTALADNRPAQYPLQDQ